MDTIISTILEHYKTLIIKYQNPGWFTKLVLGTPPDTWIISQKPYVQNECIILVDKVNCKWEITKDTIKEVPLEYDQKFKDNIFNKSCFSKIAYGYFWVSDDRRIVHIGWQLGPTYGEGWDFDVINKDGQINLLKKNQIWVS